MLSEFELILSMRSWETKQKFNEAVSKVFWSGKETNKSVQNLFALVSHVSDDTASDKKQLDKKHIKRFQF